MSYKQHACLGIRRITCFTIRVVTALSMLLGAAAFGQADFEKGFQAYQSYHGSDFDTVNLANGNLILDIPLISYEQRGGLPPLVISIRSNATTFQSTPPYLNGPLDTKQHEVSSGIVGAPWGQPHVVISPGALTWKEERIASSSKTPSGAPVYLTRFVATDESGATHSLGNNIANSAAGAVPGIRYSVDGSGLMLQPGTTRSGPILVDRHGNTGGLIDPVGNAITLQGPCAQAPGTGDYFNPGLAQWEGYAHGTASATTIVDSVGRTIPNPSYLPPAVPYSCIVDIDASYHPAHPDTNGCETWNFPGQHQGTVPFVFCYQQIALDAASIPIPLSPGSKIPNGGTSSYSCNPAIAGSVGDVSCETINENWWVLTSVELPNHKKWSFTYDSYGQVSGVSLPTGATIEYEYSTRLSCGNPPGEIPVSGLPTWPYSNLMSSRMVSKRSLNVHDDSPIKRWMYHNEIGSGWGGSSNVGRVTVTDPDENETIHEFDLIGESVCGPYETKARYFQGKAQLGTGLKAVTTSYSFLGTDFANPTNFSNYTEVGVLPSTVTTTIPNASPLLASQVAYTYDSFGTYQDYTGLTHKFSFGQLLSMTESDWSSPNAAGEPGPILRTTLHTNQWQSDYRYFAANLIDLPCLDTVFTGPYAGTQPNCAPSAAPSSQASQVAYTYDDSSSGEEPSWLGLSTSVTRWLNNGPSITTHTAYTPSAPGMPYQKTDGNGNVTTFIYDETHLFLSEVKHPATYTNEQHIPHNETFNYDRNTGSLHYSLDENNQKTTFRYDDMRRLTQVNYPDGGSESYTYHDASKYRPYFVYEKALNPTQLYTATGTADGLGRLTTTEVTASDGNIYTQTTYDNLGRVESVSNPYRSSPDGIISYQYDALGRKLYQCQQDNGSLNATSCSPQNSYLKWQYSGNATISTDEIGNVWNRSSDGLGRLTSVTEPNLYQTSYSYDVLGNLLCVDQWGGGTPGAACSSVRKRIFTYDSLSRLITSNNPESGAICYGKDGGCAGGYDRNSNLLVKRDARSITTHYKYDELNRIVSKSYSPDATNTAASCYQYDGNGAPGSGGNFIGHLVVAVTQRQPCVMHGRSVVLGTSFLTKRSSNGYDAMGRLLGEMQCTFAICQSNFPSYNPSYTYDYVGNVVRQTNGVIGTGIHSPGQIRFTNCYDSTNRLSLVVNGSASCAPNSVVNGALFSSPTYHPAGGLTSALFGTGLSLSRTYDVRLRIAGERDNERILSTATPSSATVQILGNTDQTH